MGSSSPWSNAGERGVDGEAEEIGEIDDASEELPSSIAKEKSGLSVLTTTGILEGMVNTGGTSSCDERYCCGRS